VPISGPACVAGSGSNMGLGDFLKKAVGFVDNIAGGGFTGGLVSSVLGGASAQSHARDEAKRQMDYQERMSSTAHQREVKDLLAAGLNPMLTMGHPGASTPQGAMAPQHDVVTPAVNSGLMAARTKAEIRNIEAQTAKTIAETPDMGTTMGGNNVRTALREKIMAEAETALNQKNISHQTALKLSQEIGNLAVQGNILQIEQILKKYGISEAKAMSEYWSSLIGQYSPYLKPIGGISSALGAAAAGKYIMKNMPAYVGKGAKYIRSSKNGKGNFVDMRSGELYH